MSLDDTWRPGGSFRLTLRSDYTVNHPQVRSLYTLYNGLCKLKTLAILQSILSGGGTIESLELRGGHQRFLVTTAPNWKLLEGLKLQVYSTSVIQRGEEGRSIRVELCGSHLPLLRYLLEQKIRIVGFRDRKAKASLRSEYTLAMDRYTLVWAGHPNILPIKELH